MSTLSSGTIVGGVAVEIAADLTKLRAGFAQAKAEAVAFERAAKVTIPVTLDTTKLRAEAPKAVAAAQAVILALPPVRIPLMLDVSGIGRQMAMIRAAVGGAMVVSAGSSGGGMVSTGLGPIPTITTLNRGQLLLPGPAVGPSAGGWAGVQYGPTASTFRARNNNQWVGSGGATNAELRDAVSERVQAVGGSGQAISAAEGAAIAANPRLLAGIRTLFIAHAATRLATDVVGGVNEIRAMGRAKDRGDLDAEVDAKKKMTDRIVEGGNVFLGAGSLASEISDLAPDASEIERAFEHPSQIFSGKKAKSRGQIKQEIEDTRQQAAAQDKRTAAGVERAMSDRGEILRAVADTRQIRVGLSLTGKTASEGGVIRAQSELDDYDRERANSNRKTTDADRDKRAALVAGLTQAQKEAATQSGIFSAGVTASVAGSGFQMAGLRAYAAGDTNAQAKAERDAQRVSLVAQQNAAVAGAADSEKAGLGKANKAALGVFDAESAKQNADRIKAQAADLTQTIGTKQAAALAISRQYFQAELVAFDAKTKAELSLIADKDAKQNASDRAAAERAVMVAREQQRVASAVGMSRAGTAATGLRIQHRDNDAALVEFDARAKETLKNIADPQERAAKQAELDAQRQLIVQQQNEQRVEIKAGLDTRRAQAGAFDKYGVYQSGVAGEIGKIAGQEAEARGIAPEFRAQLRDTQIAELESDKKRITAGDGRIRYSNFDAKYDAVGGTESEDTKILKLIEDHLRALLAQGAQTANGNATPAVP